MITVDHSGTKRWRNSAGRIHRENGPAVIHANGTLRWLQNGILHRRDGPAVMLPSGEHRWYINGKLHRVDGPAVEGKYMNEWAIQGFPVNSFKQFQLLTDCDDEQLVTLKLKYGEINVST